MKFVTKLGGIRTGARFAKNPKAVLSSFSTSSMDFSESAQEFPGAIEQRPQTYSSLPIRNEMMEEMRKADRNFEKMAKTQAAFTFPHLNTASLLGDSPAMSVLLDTSRQFNGAKTKTPFIQSEDDVPPNREEPAQRQGGQNNKFGMGVATVAALVLAAAILKNLSNEQSKEQGVEKTAPPKVEEVRSLKDRQLLDKDHQIAAVGSPGLGKRVDALIDHIGSQKEAGKDVPPELAALHATFVKDGTLNIPIAPTSNSHAYINFRRDRNLSAEKIGAIDSVKSEPQTAFTNAIMFGGKDITKTEEGERLKGSDKSENLKVFALGPAGADRITSKEVDVDGSKVLHNHTTAEHALVGDVFYSVQTDKEKGHVDQCIIGVGEGHSYVTGKSNLSSQAPLFGALFKSALPVMEQMAQDKGAGKEYDKQKLQGIAAEVPSTRSEKLVGMTMYGSSAYQALTNSLNRSAMRSNEHEM